MRAGTRRRGSGATWAGSWAARRPWAAPWCTCGWTGRRWRRSGWRGRASGWTTCGRTRCRRAGPRCAAACCAPRQLGLRGVALGCRGCPRGRRRPCRCRPSGAHLLLRACCILAMLVLVLGGQRAPVACSRPGDSSDAGRLEQVFPTKSAMCLVQQFQNLNQVLTKSERDQARRRSVLRVCLRDAHAECLQQTPVAPHSAPPVPLRLLLPCCWRARRPRLTAPACAPRRWRRN